jgi:hypothetical protein
MEASDFIAGLTARRPDSRDIAAGAAGIAAIAIGHATRAGHGFFVTGLDWTGPAVHVRAAPVTAAGLVSGPVVSAYFVPGPETAWQSPLSALPLPAQAAELARRYPAWHVWFGPETREWWAIPRDPSQDRLIGAPTADVLASRLQGEPAPGIGRGGPTGETGYQHPGPPADPRAGYQQPRPGVRGG